MEPRFIPFSFFDVWGLFFIKYRTQAPDVKIWNRGGPRGKKGVSARSVWFSDLLGKNEPYSIQYLTRLQSATNQNRVKIVQVEEAVV